MWFTIFPLLWRGHHPVFRGSATGDPLGSLLFCLTIHDMVQQLCSELNVFYLYKGTLGGSLDDMLQDFSTVQWEAGELGLQLEINHQ